ncbi:hypothetical protein [Streptomyces bungoensis]|uniref:hypothetical protein n=1 Tax=Streptomyces bungoensis TaxID=285568 RepID=UPI00131D91F3|nr:hypothetical protein [Streptomyces bungoensis]
MDSSIAVPLEVLKQVAALLRRLTPEEIEKLANGQAKLVCEPLAKRASAKKSAVRELPHVEEIKAALTGMDSREAGYSYLGELGLNKEELRRLASNLDLPMPRSDTADRVKDRIIEATIGYRLRSEAIRGSAPAVMDGPAPRRVDHGTLD